MVSDNDICGLFFVLVQWRKTMIIKQVVTHQLKGEPNVFKYHITSAR
jgi:hypothetical protein